MAPGTNKHCNRSSASLHCRPTEVPHGPLNFKDPFANLPVHLLHGLTKGEQALGIKVCMGALFNISLWDLLFSPLAWLRIYAHKRGSFEYQSHCALKDKDQPQHN